jgi:hypothetical protein
MDVINNVTIYKGVFFMGKSNKSKRFVQQGKDSVTKHAERFPYHTSLSESEERKMNNQVENSLGGI